MKNYYTVLEIGLNASQDEIKKAYRVKAIKYHPDKHFGDTYLADKFIEAKEAYEVLSDASKKKNYDFEHNKITNIENNSFNKNSKFEEREFENQFHYDPYKAFYAYQDRNQQDTPQFPPKFTHWGKEVPTNADFFRFPKRIGKIISAFSDLGEGWQRKSLKDKILTYAKFMSIAITISSFIIFVYGVTGPIWICLLIGIPLAISIWMSNAESSFKHTCNFIGVNGFASYTCENERNNIVDQFELNFNDVTELISAFTRNYKNGDYTSTEYVFRWSKKGNIVKEYCDKHFSKENTPPAHVFTDFWLNTWAERYWTIYLLDNMETELSKNGYIEFTLMGVQPYIRLGVGYIEFIKEKENFRYNFNDIKKIYTKGSNLFIEHKNYEKKFYFFESGDKHGIPLMYLSNRQYFYRLMELFIGHSLVVDK